MTYEMDKKLREMELIQSGYDEGIEKGIEQGIELGKIETQKNMILSMFNDKMSYDSISKYTKISIPKIKEVIKSNELLINNSK